MLSAPRYALIGRGRWAAKIQAMLEGEQRRTVQIEHARRRPTESAGDYVSRLADALDSSRVQIAWLCVPPGSHITWMLEAAIQARVHVIVEKPWKCSCAETKRLIAAASKRIAIGIDYEYCLLDEIQAWRAKFSGLRGLRFTGSFHTRQPDRLGIPALENLGSHLLAIRRYAVPLAYVGDLSCAYSSRDERRAFVGREILDFTLNSQPVLQRFVAQFERADPGVAFDFGLEFALAVAQDVANYCGRQTAESRTS
jgi:predicted dehydrogenase